MTADHGAVVEDSILFAGVTLGRGARVRRAIVDDEVLIQPGASIGLSPERDRERFTVTENGIVVVPRGMIVRA